MTEPPNCQLFGIVPMADGPATDVHRSPYMNFRVWLARTLGPARKRAIKKKIVYGITLASKFTGRQKAAAAPMTAEATLGPQFAPGDRVLVQSREFIEFTLGPFHDYKGLAVMPGMWQYCGTEQRILKPVRRFVDERDLRMHKSSGIILLEGLMCQGTDVYPCDRSCFFFWREEWLKRSTDGTAVVKGRVP